jgi:hypothetical protein
LLIFMDVLAAGLRYEIGRPSGWDSGRAMIAILL